VAGLEPALLARFDDVPLLMAAVDVPNSYPAQLQTLLANRYSAQTPVVVNEGLPGERVEGGVTRLPGVLALHVPEVLLLQEGVNNLNSRNNPDDIPIVVNGLRTMIREARNRGIQVLLGTLLPQRLGACRAYAPGLIEPANTQIRALAGAEGATIVDLYQAFAGMTDTLLGQDGLHPNEAGYERMAQMFVDVVRQRLETAPGQ
jgi:acyl-CoA thioesterase-1